MSKHATGRRCLVTMLGAAIYGAVALIEARVLHYIPRALRQTYAAEVAALEGLYTALGHHAGVSAGFSVRSAPIR